MGYRRIAKHLNSKNITTFDGKKWDKNNVYSVLQRYLDRLERLEHRNKTFDAVWSKMQLTYERFVHWLMLWWIETKEYTISILFTFTYCRLILIYYRCVIWEHY